jgi:ESCRT-II complex subunit VPS22
MSRKGVGIGAFDRSRLTSAHYASHGSSLRANNAQALETQLAVFRSLLQQFAQTHAKDIRSDPSFRAQFARMCTAIGVDPLASSSSSSSGGGGGSAGGSIWAQLLGKTVNDFYFELAVRIVEVCGATRGENGGLLGLREVRERLSQGRGNGGDISEDDVRRAVETLKPLGGSYGIVRVGRKEYIRSVPRELSNDQVAAVEAAQVLGYVSVSMLRDNLGWEPARCRTVIDDLVAEGMLWVDAQTGGEWEYWSPTVMVETDQASIPVAD